MPALTLLSSQLSTQVEGTRELTDAKKKPGYLTGKRQSLMKRWSALETDRSSWWAHWQQISEVLLPRNGRFMMADRSRGTRRDNEIYDNTGTRALRVMSAGMMAGATSPARPWFTLATDDDKLNNFHPVREWTQDVRDLLLRDFARSNTYRVLPTIYEELGAFGTAASVVVPHLERGVHHYPSTIGQYCIASDWEGRVTTFFREFEAPVHAVVREFGYDNCSPTLQNAYDNNNLDEMWQLMHGIEPRHDRDHTMLDQGNMRWSSVYFEKSCEQDWDDILRESGFDQFPVLCPRWATPGQDTYGSSPGMEALGDVRGLQHLQFRRGQGVDYQTKPPMQITGQLKDRDLDWMPGAYSFINSPSPQGGARPLYDASTLRLDHLLADIQDHRSRIDSSFFADLFLMLATADKQMTATEVAERHEEKLLMLGPTLERLHHELLEPMVDIAFTSLVARGEMPPPPPELEGMELNVEFVSMLAQAQKAIQTHNVDRWLVAVASAAEAVDPGIRDKVDTDELADGYAELLGVDARFVRTDTEVKALRTARAQAQAAAAQVEVAAQSAKALKDSAQAHAAAPNELNSFSGLSGQATAGAL